jgi:hypothetical protein
VFRALRELRLGAAPPTLSPPPLLLAAPGLAVHQQPMTAVQAAQKLAGGKAPCTAAAIAAAAAAAAAAATPRPQRQQQQQQQPGPVMTTMTDKGLMRLFACPALRRLELSRLPAITLAGVAALASGSSALESVRLVACCSVATAGRDEAAAAGVVGGGRRFVEVEVVEV